MINAILHRIIQRERTITRILISRIVEKLG